MAKQKTIVIIEDDKDDQDILREAFGELEVKNTLLFFDDCDKAYAHLMSEREKPFLIISDINLPRINGIEFKKRIDTTDYLRRKAIPFVFFTTSDNQAIINEAFRITNLQGYFKKGQSMQEIKEDIRCIMSYWSASRHPDTD